MRQNPKPKSPPKSKTPLRQPRGRPMDRRAETVASVERAIEAAKLGHGKPWPTVPQTEPHNFRETD